ncbi:MAG: HNH endonuclease domain-containing protein [Legionella sp.]|uniref:HNH endonuclease n=1 Tax=Legionella sp. TaxID=459 RepID=UPI00283D3DAF|nr:HNH endonuclease domain-containing protein [Legionella sp.]
MSDFTPKDYWKALILYGLNQATYKIALGKTLLTLAKQGLAHVPWEMLSKEFFNQYIQRLSQESAMPQQSIPSRQTVMERIVAQYQSGKLPFDEAIDEVGNKAFGDVIHRFDNLGNDESFKGKFYGFDFGKELVLTDDLHIIVESCQSELDEELDTRWSLLEGAFAIQQENYSLSNDLRQIYLENGHKRKNLTKNIPFLQGYQGNTCFYCGEPVLGEDIHVDHVLPRQVIHHDEIWNLVISHSFCNQLKSDKLVGSHYIQKLIARNENIMGSNHPWKKKIMISLGKTPEIRRAEIQKHYYMVKDILGTHYWGGVPNYHPETDQFYKQLITVLNNGGSI